MIQVEGIFAGGGAVTAAPIIGKDFNWTGGDGTYVVLDDGDGNWRIKFLSSGTFTPLKDMVIDVFLVGAGGGHYSSVGTNVPSAGGGGYTTTVKSIVLGAGTAYAVTVGAAGAASSAGGTTSAFGSQALGGNPGTYVNLYNGNTVYYQGGNGGSGGSGGGTYAGGVDGGNGGSGTADFRPGTGQGTTTREFAETTGDLYSTGGGSNITSTVPNSGNGGTRTWSAAAGIVIIRQHKEAA